MPTIFSVSATKSIRKTFFTKFDSYPADDINMSYSKRDLGGKEIAYEFAAIVKYEYKITMPEAAKYLHSPF